MRKAVTLILTLFSLLFLSSCEEEIDLDIPAVDAKVVVYGIIENDLPPFVILTNSLDFFKLIDSVTVAESFISGANVTYSVDGKTFKMQEYPIEQNGFKLTAYAPAPIDTQIFFGIEIPIFDDLQFGKIGKTYDLRIEVDGKILTSTTTIPDTLPLRNFKFDAHPSTKKQDLVSLSCAYDDPEIPGNFGRLFTSVNGEQFFPDRFQSVYTDELINGGTWSNFVIPKGENPNLDFDSETYSYFNRGDTVVVKWCAIDKAHYDFWITLETDRNNSGNPFGRPAIIKTNINGGGLGVWGGYGAVYYTLYAPE